MNKMGKLKTFFTILLVILSCNVINVNAEGYDVIKIQSTGESPVSGQANIKYWDKKTWKETVVGSTIYTSYQTYTSYTAAQNAGRAYVATNPSKYVYYMVKTNKSTSNSYTCSKTGTTYYSETSCKNSKYPYTSTSTGRCTKDGALSRWKCSLTGSKHFFENKCKEACKKTTTYQLSCGAYCKKNTKTKTTYQYQYRIKSEIEKSESLLKTGQKNVVTPVYKIVGSGDPTYCIQPGHTGPSRSGTDYCLNTEIDLSKCKNLTDENHYYCGLAAILYQTVKEDGTYADGSIRYVDNGQYSYAAITTALRLYVAVYSHLDGINNIGMESDHFTDYISSTNVYAVSATKALNDRGYTDNGISCSSAGIGLLCGSDADYKNGLKLLRKALDGGVTFLDNEQTELNSPKFSQKTENENKYQIVKVTVKMPEKYVEKMVECTKEEVLNKNSACKVFVQVKDAKGNLVNSTIQDAYCKKEFCEVTIRAEKKECSVTGGTLETTKYKLETYLKEYSLGGYVRQYVNCADPNNSQVMMTFAVNQKKMEIEGTGSGAAGTMFPYEISVPCSCDEDKRCNSEDMGPRTDLPKECEGQGVFDSGEYDTYTVGDKKDPYMNCILNACDPNEKKKYNYSDEYGVNTKVCNIYCRDEIYFYMANKTRVYAGMQFQYDIVPKLQADSVIEEPYINKVGKSDYKLTSVVLQKRQCTTEIYYDTKNADGKTWLDQYDEAVKNMMTKYNEWKKHESIYNWQMIDNGGDPQKITASAKVCAHESSSGCGDRSCYTSSDLSSFNYVYGWPTQTYSDTATTCSISSENKESYTTWTATSGTGENKGVTFTMSSGSGTHSLTSGSFNCGSTSCGSAHCCKKPDSCRCGNAVTCGANEEGCTPKADTMNCCCDSSYSTDGTCTAGSQGDENAAKTAEEKAYGNYKDAVDMVAQLIYDLQNCNLYVAPKSDEEEEDEEDLSDKYTSKDTVIQDYYHNKVLAAHHEKTSGSIKRAKGSSINDSSTKDYILGQSLCKTASDCVELEVQYDDENYGKETKMSKEVGAVYNELNGTYHCKNADDSNPNCYKYIKNTEVEVNAENYTSDKTKKHDIVYCDNGARTKAKCWTEKIDLPTNDFATFITVTEADFWQPKKYQTQVYTGIVSEGDGGDDGYTSLDNFVYPVSNNNKTGSTGVYDFDYHFTNITLKSSNDLLEYEHTCSYDVLNTTKLYDCEIKIDATGNLDLSDCQNSCYDIKNGVPIIRDECNSWDEDEGKGYGFIYRNVEVGNLFPNGLRGIGTNWDEATAAISAIESTADSVYYNDDYLEYKYVLTPNAINRIRDYNQNQDSNGGYLNLTLSGCDKVDLSTGLQAFYNCKSSFLGDISQPSNSYGVKPIKTDGQSTGGGN